MWQVEKHDALLLVEMFSVAEDGVGEGMLDGLQIDSDTVGAEAVVGLTEVDQKGEKELLGETLTWYRWQHCEFLGERDIQIWFVGNTQSLNACQLCGTNRAENCRVDGSKASKVPWRLTLDFWNGGHGLVWDGGY